MSQKSVTLPTTTTGDEALEEVQEVQGVTVVRTEITEEPTEELHFHIREMLEPGSIAAVLSVEKRAILFVFVQRKQEVLSTSRRKKWNQRTLEAPT